MAKIKDLEMAAAITNNQHISIQSSFLGLRQQVVYTPTQSPVSITIQDYAPDAGEQLLRLLGLPVDKLAEALQKQGKPQSTPVGHFRLEACVSHDQQFCALQLFRFGDFKYTAATELLCQEGPNAKVLASVL